jgi:hypothetical protein
MSLQEIQDLKETNSNSVSETLILDENKLVETINNTEKNLDFTPTKILEIVSKSFKFELFFQRHLNILAKNLFLIGYKFIF